MKQFVLSLLSILLFTCAYGQQKVELNNSFNAIEISGKINVEIIPDTICKVYASAYGVDIQKLKWTVKDGLISFSIPSGMLDNGRIDMSVHADTLNYIVCNGCDVTMSDTLINDQFTIYSLSANNNLNLLVDVDKLFLKANGKSKINIGGIANDALIDISVGAKLDASGANIAACRIIAAGASEAILNVSNYLDAKATTQSTIYYMGSPELVVKTNLWGEVIPIPQF